MYEILEISVDANNRPKMCNTHYEENYLNLGGKRNDIYLEEPWYSYSQYAG